MAMLNSIDCSESTPDCGILALCAVAGYHRIAADPAHLSRELALKDARATSTDVIRAAKLIGLRARSIRPKDRAKLLTIPTPALVRLSDGGFAVFGGATANKCFRLVDPRTRLARDLPREDFLAALDGEAILVQKRLTEAVSSAFGFSWFLPSIWRYRKPLGHVLLASLFVQIFALVTPIFFQIVVDKVLTHKSWSTLYVLTVGLVLIGLFDVILQYLRTYALAHTTNRIDVELGQRLFQHLLRLPISYFETRATGQTVARVRELESIRSFLTGQAMFSGLDLSFTFIFIAVLTAYSWKLTLIVVGAVPFYLAIGFLVRPPLRAKVKEKFNRGAASQQFLVETVVGIQTVKSAAVEPLMQAEWEERLAAYVRTGFDATMLGALGQNLIQYVSKLTNALLLLFGAYAVIKGDLSVGALIAFNMIAGQTVAPLLRLSQLWQDFQQVQVSVDRLGDILNHTPERIGSINGAPPRPRGRIEISRVTFRYRADRPPAIRDLSLCINEGEVAGLVGPSGSGKSTLSKLIQRMYIPEEGQITLDGADLSHVHPAWLRSQIGVVLQDNLLFNRTIHENIAFSNPAMVRADVIAVAELTGAAEFIAKLPDGYDTIVEERGANLSGGQRQRIAIARALATDPPVLILDEATSALDYESERIIHRNMGRIVKNRTVLIIAHRLGAVRGCDRIFGMEDGRLVEVGSHSELVRREDGLYARLWAVQTEGAQA